MSELQITKCDHGVELTREKCQICHDAEYIYSLESKVQHLCSEVSRMEDEWYSPEHMDAVQKRTIDPLRSEVSVKDNALNWVISACSDKLLNHPTDSFARMLRNIAREACPNTASTLQTVKERIADPQIVDVDLEDL